MIYRNYLDAHKDRLDCKSSIGWVLNIIIPLNLFRIGESKII